MGGSIQGGILTRVYKSGSIIYFENDKSEYIYILKSGRVLLTYTKIDTGEELKEEVRQGEFFGVKSALGKYPREETAQTIGETVVLALSLSDFERMILKNVNVVRKMLRVFSNQLRRLNRTVRTVLGDTDNVNPQLELFRIGEHYFKSGDFTKASYAFKKYMEYYPDTDYAKLAMDRIKTISSGGTAAPSQSAAKTTSNSDFDDFKMDDGDDVFSFDDEPAKPKKAAAADDGFSLSPADPAIASDFSSEMDDFLSDDDSGDLGDFTFDEPAKSKTPTLKELFDKAESSMDMSNFKAALEGFREIMSKGVPAKPNEKSYYIDSWYNAGICCFEMKDYKSAMNYFAEITKSFADSDKLKGALFYVGSIFEVAGQADKAVVYYNKTLNMSPKDSINAKALDRIKALQKR